MKITLQQKLAINTLYGAMATSVIWDDIQEPKMKIVKLDGRHRGYPEYKYKVQFSNPKGFYLRDDQRIAQMVEVRNWFHDTFGPSCEYEYIWCLKNDNNFNAKWCWDNKGLDMKIFIADDATLNWFSLKWIK